MDDIYFNLYKIYKDWRETETFVTTDMDAPIEHIMPHYTDTRFKHARTVFLRDGYAVVRGLSDTEFVESASNYVYSDRIDYSDRERAAEIAKASKHRSLSAAWYEVYLREALHQPTLKLVHILAGYNWSNGFPYQVFGYIISKED